MRLEEVTQIINMLGLVSLAIFQLNRAQVAIQTVIQVAIQAVIQVATQEVILMIVAIRVRLDHLPQGQEDNIFNMKLNKVANQLIATFFF